MYGVHRLGLLNDTMPKSIDQWHSFETVRRYNVAACLLPIIKIFLPSRRYDCSCAITTAQLHTFISLASVLRTAVLHGRNPLCYSDDVLLNYHVVRM
jgi:hypothetical protein